MSILNPEEDLEKLLDKAKQQLDELLKKHIDDLKAYVDSRKIVITFEQK